ncbi:MAG: hypothetical protein HQK53_03810 [Oligoflexia bacterium]|nr:hypothetical protein [Oligoflexia bacterium]
MKSFFSLTFSLIFSITFVAATTVFAAADRTVHAPYRHTFTSHIFSNYEYNLQGIDDIIHAANDDPAHFSSSNICNKCLILGLQEIKTALINYEKERLEKISSPHLAEMIINNKIFRVTMIGNRTFLRAIERETVPYLACKKKSLESLVKYMRTYSDSDNIGSSDFDNNSEYDVNDNSARDMFLQNLAKCFDIFSTKIKQIRRDLKRTTSAQINEIIHQDHENYLEMEKIMIVSDFKSSIAIIPTTKTLNLTLEELSEKNIALSNIETGIQKNIQQEIIAEIDEQQRAMLKMPNIDVNPYARNTQKGIEHNYYYYLSLEEIMNIDNPDRKMSIQNKKSSEDICACAIL